MDYFAIDIFYMQLQILNEIIKKYLKIVKGGRGTSTHGFCHFILVE